MRLILASAPGLAEIGRFGALAAAIAQLPAALVAQQPWLQFWQGTCRLVTDPLAARACFESAYRAFRGAGDARGSYLAWSGIVDSFVFFWGDFTDLRAWITEFSRLRREFPKFPELAVEERAIYAIFTAHVFADPEWDRISEWATRAEHLAHKGADPSLRIMTVASLGLYLPWLGEFARYEALMQTARVLARSEAAAPLARLNVLGMESSHALLNGDPAHALAVAREAAAFATASGVHILNRATFANAGFACAHLGDLAAADVAVEKYKKALKPESRLDEAQWFYLAGYVDVLLGDLPRAEERCRTALCLAQGVGTPIALAMCQMLLARVLADCRQLDEARALLDHAHAFICALRSNLYEFECWVVHAWIALRAGDTVECVAHVRRAFALVERYGIKSYATWDPIVMAELCRIALEHDVHVSTVRRLIRSRGLAPSAAASALDAWPWPVKILTFGRFELLVDDRPVRSSTKAQKKPLELLQVLIALGGQAVPEEHLSEVLWPDSDGDAAHRAFDTTLHRLRKLLGREQAISVEGARVSLDARHVWVDTRAFERRLAQADETAAGPLADALLLYRGPFLGRDATKWALPMRERMRSMFLRAIERLGRIYDEDVRPHEVTECYRRGIEVDPLAETLYRRLMLHYGERNQHTEALSTYQRLHAMLASQLGVKPSAESRELYERLRREASA
jgi:LuxR family transcriptional regulator, maltose regulon positive regulatory protein